VDGINQTGWRERKVFYPTQLKEKMCNEAKTFSAIGGKLKRGSIEKTENNS